MNLVSVDGNDFFKVIAVRRGHQYEDGTYTPLYTTFCKKPTWANEGLLLTSGLFDATKFEVDNNDIDSLLAYCKEHVPKYDYEVVLVSRLQLGTNTRSFWKDTKGDFEETRLIGRIYVPIAEYSLQNELSQLDIVKSILQSSEFGCYYTEVEGAADYDGELVQTIELQVIVTNVLKFGLIFNKSTGDYLTTLVEGANASKCDCQSEN